MQLQSLSFSASKGFHFRLSEIAAEAQGLPFYAIFACDVQITWQSYLILLRTAESTGELCLPPLPCLVLLVILPNTGCP